MAKGLLTFTGTIDLNQFWPKNINGKSPYDSDADTVKVKVDMASITHTNGAGKVKKTKALNNAGFWKNVKNSKGVKTKKFFPVINSSNIITMRLQGIDAPELHYDTGKPLYRQHMGETSTIALYNFLKANATGTSIACEVFTQVDEPNEVFDKYGRCVGDINIKEKNGSTTDINHWLIEKGYAFPAFYNSMSFKEVKDIITLANKAQKAKLNIWKYVSYQMAKMDLTLIHDKKVGTYSATKDKKSPVIFPKLFRRLWALQIGEKKTFTTQAYNKFLETKKDDKVCLTSVFLKSGFPKKKPPILASFVKVNGKIDFKPAEIVFQEGGTTLKDDKGKKVTKF